MTSDEYWKGDPRLAVAYRDAANKRIEEQSRMMWLQGEYVYEAVRSVVHNYFTKKGSKAIWYPEKPYRMTPLTEEEKKAAAEAERQKAIKSLDAWKTAWDRAHG